MAQPDRVFAPGRFFAGLMLLLLMITGTACSDLSRYDEDRINKVLADSLIGVTESTDVRMELMIDGYLKVVAESPRSEATENEGVSLTKLIGPPVHVTVYDTTGTVETVVESNRAVYNSRTSVFDFEGDVFVQTKNNRTLRSEQLEWSELTKRISTPGFVIITTQTDSITGYGFNGAEDLSRYTLRNITGQFTIN